MKISAVNSTPLKPQSFGNDVNKAQFVLEKSKELGDRFAKNPEEKSALGTFVSVLGAFATCFLLGKGLASKAMEVFPKLSDEIVTLSKKAVSGASVVAGKLKNIHIPEKVTSSKVGNIVRETAEKVSSNQKVKNLAGKASEQASNIFAKIKAQPADKIIKNAAGIASMAILGSQIATVDGNDDGIADIAQKDVNAYKNAIGSIGIIGDIMKSFS